MITNDRLTCETRSSLFHPVTTVYSVQYYIIYYLIISLRHDPWVLVSGRSFGGSCKITQLRDPCLIDGALLSSAGRNAK